MELSRDPRCLGGRRSSKVYRVFSGCKAREIVGARFGMAGEGQCVVVVVVGKADCAMAMMGTMTGLVFIFKTKEIALSSKAVLQSSLNFDGIFTTLITAWKMPMCCCSQLPHHYLPVPSRLAEGRPSGSRALQGRLSEALVGRGPLYLTAVWCVCCSAIDRYIICKLPCKAITDYLPTRYSVRSPSLRGHISPRAAPNFYFSFRGSIRLHKATRSKRIFRDGWGSRER